jgi:hypothetical protein
MSMSAYVSLPAVIQVILMDPAYKGGKFGDIRELMMGELLASLLSELWKTITCLASISERINY